MDAENFDRIKLPKASANEDLETLSRQKLLPLFPLHLFELRDENQKDKGIDFIGELKRNGLYTNFRFAIQLKATQSAQNEDGSISFSIDVSNINYLMNNGMPAYYILYQKDLDGFYYETTAAVHEGLTIKYNNDNFPDKFTIRFDKQLTTSVLQSLHADIFHRGILLRNLNGLLNVNLQQGKLSSNIIIDENQKVYTTEQKAQFIEKYGFLLLNKRNFKRIVDIEQQCYPLPVVSATFHFVSGMAYYHRSQMYKAIDHFKSATKIKDLLNQDLQSMLSYYYEMAKYSLGMISSEKIGQVIQQMEQSDYLTLFLRIQQAFDQFSADTGDQDESLKVFFDEMTDIKHGPVCDESMGMIVNSHILLVNGFDVNLRIMNLLYDLKTLGFQTAEQADAHKKLVDWFDERANSLQDLALQQGNLITYYIVCLNIIRTKYNYIAIFNYITYYDYKLKRPDFQFSEEQISLVDQLIKVLDDAAAYFESESFVENQAAALSIKYELLKFTTRDTAANEISEKIAQIIEVNDLYSMRSNYEALIGGDTAHRKTLQQIQAIFNAAENLKNQSQDLRQKMQDIDQQEKALNKKQTVSKYQIHFFRWGYLA
jgi:hypothetical protein